MSIKESRQRLKEAEEAYKSAHPGRDLTEAREELTHARGEYLADCAEVVERLDYLLGPFALEADAYHRKNADSVIPVLDCGSDCHYTVGDLRALAKLYEELR